jgi:hypothetical protein
MQLPLRRHHGPLGNALGDGIIVCDERNRRVHHLNSTMAAIWQRCNGIEDMARAILPCARASMPTSTRMWC